MKQVGPLGALWSRAYLLLTFTALFWAGNSIVGRAARELVPPAALAFWRWAIALALLLPLAWPHLRRDWPALKARWPIVVLLGALGIGSFNTLLELGFGSSIRREWAWRVKRGESLANLQAFKAFAQQD